MRRFLRENLGWKLLSLAISVGLWYALVEEPRYAVSVSAPLEFSHVPPELEIDITRPARITLELQGPAAQLGQRELNDVAVIVSLASVEKPCERTFTLSDGNVKLPSGVRLVRAVPSQIRLRFERRVSREVPVRLRLAAPPPAGFVIRTETILPSTLRIIGPESRVNLVEFAETDAVELAPTEGTQEFRVNVFVPESQVRFESAPEAIVRIVLARNDGGESR